MTKKNENGQSAKAASAKKNELYQFVLEDYEGKVGFTDYGTKEQMAALYAEALLRMERFSIDNAGTKTITLKDSGKENGGEWSTFEWDGWDLIYIRFQKLPTFNSRSSRDLSKEMNYFNKKY